MGIVLKFTLICVNNLVCRYYTFVKQNMVKILGLVNNQNSLRKQVQRYKGKLKTFKFHPPGWFILGLGASITPHPSEWRKEKNVAHHIAMAEIALKDGDLKKAENLLIEALAISSTTQTIGVTCVYDMLATLAYRQGEVSKAERILVQVIERLIEMGLPSNHNTVVNFSLKLARIYSNLGQDNLAEMGFRNCLAIQKKKYISGDNDEETTMLWINTLFWYGKFLANKERYLEAKLCFDSAYTLCANVKSIETNQVMVMLYNLGEMAFAIGDLEGALRHLMNAVILGRSTGSPDLPTYYTKIGLVYLARGLTREAHSWCASARDAARPRLLSEAEDCLAELDKIRRPPPTSQ